MVHTISPIAYYAQKKAEIDLLTDVEALFVLAFIEHSGISSKRELQREILWEPRRFGEVIQRLETSGALEARTDSEHEKSWLISAVGREVVQIFNSISSDENAQTRAEQLFRDGVKLGGNPRSIDKAAEAYREAVTLAPKIAEALLNLGSIFFAKGQYVSAKKYYQRALSAKPSYPMAHFNLGCVYHEMNETQLAEVHYKAAIALAPQYQEPYYNLAVLFEELQQHSKAVPYWRSYIDLDPESEWADIARRQLSATAKKRPTSVQPAPVLEHSPNLT